MRTLVNQLCRTVARFTPARTVLVAMLLGPTAGAFLAYGALAAQEPNEVVIDNFTFGPKDLTIPVGTTVKWVNHDDIPHTVVETSTSRAFRSKALDTDDSYSFTFASAGTFSYFCSLHPQMTGKIVVK